MIQDNLEFNLNFLFPYNLTSLHKNAVSLKKATKGSKYTHHINSCCSCDAVVVVSNIKKFVCTCATYIGFYKKIRGKKANISLRDMKFI